jgi:FdhD protein
MNGYITRPVVHVKSGIPHKDYDNVTVEEPLEVKISNHGKIYNGSIIMRTPVDDFSLAAGFLFTEGIIKPDDIMDINYANDAKSTEKTNIVVVSVKSFNKARLSNRNFFVNSSCGVCGKTSINDIYVKTGHLVEKSKGISYKQLVKFPGVMNKNQEIFMNTGGIHAAAIINYDGKMLSIAEDIGRHNAVDKAIGKLVLQGMTRSGEAVLQVSGRAGFEILQKAAVFGIPIVSSVSAPSSLAVELADEFGMTLASFVRGNNFSVYAHPERIITD